MTERVKISKPIMVAVDGNSNMLTNVAKKKMIEAGQLQRCADMELELSTVHNYDSILSIVKKYCDTY